MPKTGRKLAALGYFDKTKWTELSRESLFRSLRFLTAQTPSESVEL
ncbi:MAG: hypothetical protein AAFY72_01405 [Cyanobacteria bacterium J06649_4]